MHMDGMEQPFIYWTPTVAPAGVTRREYLFADLKQRLRDVRQGPDGLIYLLTDGKPGSLLKVEPMQ